MVPSKHSSHTSLRCSLHRAIFGSPIRVLGSDAGYDPNPDTLADNPRTVFCFEEGFEDEISEIFKCEGWATQVYLQIEFLLVCFNRMFRTHVEEEIQEAV